MTKRKLGLGSISLFLVVFAFLWAFTIDGVCMGDKILAMLNIPFWSDSATSSRTHYTVFYALIFLVPALLLGLKCKSDLFATVGKWSSIGFLALFLIFIPFMVI